MHLETRSLTTHPEAARAAMTFSTHRKLRMVQLPVAWCTAVLTCQQSFVELTSTVTGAETGFVMQGLTSLPGVRPLMKMCSSAIQQAGFCRLRKDLMVACITYRRFKQQMSLTLRGLLIASRSMRLTAHLPEVELLYWPRSEMQRQYRTRSTLRRTL